MPWLRIRIPRWRKQPGKILEARGGIEPPIKVLQTFALPLGDRAWDANLSYQTATPASSLVRQSPMAGISVIRGTQPSLHKSIHHSSFNPNCTCRELVEV